MNILGLNAYHGDAAAALVVDGELVAAVEEERLNRIKHCAGFPSLAARWCLEDVGLAPERLDHVAVSRDPLANLSHKLLGALRTPNPGFIRSRFQAARRSTDIATDLSRALECPKDALRASFHNVEHHRAHASSAFFVSPFEEAAVLSVDGFGDFASTMSAHGRGPRLRVLDRVHYPHSLGIFYTAITQWLGFPKYGDEGKVMGLAAYGEPRYLDGMRQIVRLSDGSFSLDLDYFVHARQGVDMTWDKGSPTLDRVFSDSLCSLIGAPREPGEEIRRKHEDVAASLQAMLEIAYLQLLTSLHERTDTLSVCLAGGVALNAVANGLIRKRTGFRDVYVQPAAGDSGTAVGAAFHVWNQMLGGKRGFVMDHAYTGPSFSEVEVREAIGRAGLTSRRLEGDAFFAFVAGRLAAGDIVGWFQGRTEFGPRALGNRSILADPRSPGMKEVLNARIKHREPFRPFAPSVLSEATGHWFDDDYPSPFMVLVHKTRPERRDQLAAINHVDDTARLQTVDRSANPAYHRLIEAFADRTGVPVLLNTSFNENEPIVCTPDEAIACFQKTKMDLLVLGQHVIQPS